MHRPGTRRHLPARRRQAAAAAEHIRACAARDPGAAADAAWAAADTLHAAAHATSSRELRRAAGAYDRAARMAYGRIPSRSAEGEGLRTAARLIALTGRITDGMPLVSATLLGSLLALAAAVAELRHAQRHAAQAAAARAAAHQLHAAVTQARSQMSTIKQAPGPRRTGPATAADIARRDFSGPPQPGRPLPATTGPPPPVPAAVKPPTRAGPRR